MLARLVSNALAVGGSSALTGAVVLIWLVLGRYWQGIPPADFLDWFSANSFMIGRVMFGMTGVAALGLVASLWLDRANRRTSLLWISALVCLAALSLITGLCELPLNDAFATHAMPVERVGAALEMWLGWHVVRLALGLLAAVLGVAALNWRGNVVRAA